MASSDPVKIKAQRRSHYLRNKERLQQEHKIYNATPARQLASRLYNQQYRARNMQYILGVRRAAHLKRADEFMAFKESLGCSHCGYKVSGAALDFHHLDPKTKKRQVMSNNFNYPAGIEERKKCIVLCANCHRIETLKQKRSK